MSLDDELNAAVVRSANPTAEWIAEWYSKMDAADKKAWDKWVSDPSKPALVMFRVMRTHGYPGGETAVRDWVRKQRETL
jgi:hypothetical protein